MKHLITVESRTGKDYTLSEFQLLVYQTKYNYDLITTIIEVEFQFKRNYQVPRLLKAGGISYNPINFNLQTTQKHRIL